MFSKKIRFAAGLLAVSAGLSLPVQAQQEGAKGLFYEQLEKPTSQINTGVQYWIELHRNGNVSHVTNKTEFHSGDKIRFHVKSNVDAYAYILLKEGSAGEQAVLFPDPSHHDETKVVHGRDYSLPNDGFLTFDDNPGTERLMLLLSRTPVDAQAYLDNNQNERAQIASLPNGSKDLIPAKIVLAYEPPKDAFKSKEDTPAAPSTTVTTAGTGSTSGSGDNVSKPAIDHKQTITASTANKPGPGANHKSRVTDHKPHHTTVTTKKHSGPDAVATMHSSDKPNSVINTGAVVTVVHRDPSAVLALDLSLDHLK